MKILKFPKGQKNTHPSDVTERDVPGETGKIIESVSCHRFSLTPEVPDETRYYLYDLNNRGKDTIHITVYEYMSYYGVPIMAHPYATVEWYNHRIYFESAEEYVDFMMNRFKMVLIEMDNTCPVCGGPLGHQLRYMFSDGSGLPYDIHFCGLSCMRLFLSHFLIYRVIFANYLDHHDRRTYVVASEKDYTYGEKEPESNNSL